MRVISHVFQGTTVCRGLTGQTRDPVTRPSTPAVRVLHKPSTPASAESAPRGRTARKAHSALWGVRLELTQIVKGCPSAPSVLRDSTAWRMQPSSYLHRVPLVSNNTTRWCCSPPFFATVGPRLSVLIVNHKYILLNHLWRNSSL